MMSDVIDFGLWNIPDFHADKIKVIYDDVVKKLLETGTEKFKYSADCMDKTYNEAVAELLTKEYGDKVASTDLFATYGAAFGFTLLVAQFFEKGDPCIFEDFTFGCCSRLAAQYGLDLKSVPHDENDNICIPMLETVMKESIREKPVNKLKPWNGCIYLLAVLHNPKGTSLSEECCQSVLELARKYNYLIVCDDVYNVYDFTSNPKRRLLYFDRLTRDEKGPGNVVSNGSLSKIVFPSFRMGWIEGSPWLIDQLQNRPDLFSGGGFNILNQGLAGGMLRHPTFPSVFLELKEKYKDLQRKACTFLKDNLPNTATFRWPDGSFFIWLKLPDNVQSKDFVKVCEERNVVIMPGNSYSFDGKGGTNHIRIAYTNEPEERMFAGLKILCDIIKEL